MVVVVGENRGGVWKKEVQEWMGCAAPVTAICDSRKAWPRALSGNDDTVSPLFPLPPLRGNIGTVEEQPFPGRSFLSESC